MGGEAVDHHVVGHARFSEPRSFIVTVFEARICIAAIALFLKDEDVQIGDAIWVQHRCNCLVYV